MEAVNRSMSLAQGNWWRCLVVFVFASMLLQIGSGIVVAPVAVITQILGLGPLPVALVASVAQSLLQPLPLIASVLLYFDLRVRKEGFDIQLLAENLSAS